MLAGADSGAGRQRFGGLHWHDPHRCRSLKPAFATAGRINMRMPSNGSYWCALGLVALLASVNFLTGLAEPRGAIWDESYYLTSTERYAEGVAQFASHPPLGLMLIAAGDALLNPNRNIDTRPLARDKHADGRVIPQGFSFAGVRAASALFAVLGAMVFFALMYAITQSTFTALVFSNLFTFENAFITQFRAAQLDAFQIAFTAIALLWLTQSPPKRTMSGDCAASISAAFTARSVSSGSLTWISV